MAETSRAVGLLAYLVKFHQDQQIVVFQIYLVVPTDERCNQFDSALSRQSCVVAEGRSNRELFRVALSNLTQFQCTMQHSLQFDRQCQAPYHSLGLLTFLPDTPGAWKCGDSTCCATSVRPFSVALPITVIGVNRFTNRLRFRVGLLDASSQMVCTKDTGSMGARVLKNMTRNA